MSNIEYLGILLSFYSVIFISIELCYPKISSSRRRIVNILLIFEIRHHKILNKYSRKCSRRHCRWNRSCPYKGVPRSIFKVPIAQIIYMTTTTSNLDTLFGVCHGKNCQKMTDKKPAKQIILFKVVMCKWPVLNHSGSKLFIFTNIITAKCFNTIF